MDYHFTDPEFLERAERFAFEEVVTEEGQQLDAPPDGWPSWRPWWAARGWMRFKIFCRRRLMRVLTRFGLRRCSTSPRIIWALVGCGPS